MYCDIVKKLSVAVEANSWPLSLDELKGHLRQSSSVGTDEDALLQTFVESATVAVESHCGVSMAQRTLTMHLSGWPFGRGVVLWYPTVSSVASVKYYDGSNTLQTLDPSYYDAEVHGLRPTVSLAWGKVWPIIYDRPFPVLIEYVTSQFNSNALKLAIMMMAADFYENRESQITSQYFGERSVIQNPAMSRLLNPHVVVS